MLNKIFLRFRLIILGLLLINIFFTSQAVMAAEDRSFPAGAQEVYIDKQAGVRSDLLKNINSVVEKSIAGGYYPGAVVLVSHHGKIIYKGVFGNKQLAPAAPMQFDTVFDLASLTKVVVTTTAAMQLIEQGKLDLDATVSQYWPAFASNGKENITIRELLTHTSGFQAILPAWNAPQDRKQAYQSGLAQIEQLKLVNPPGKVFTYSDINLIVVGHLVELISGQSLDQYATQHIFKPLQMTSATFLPPADWKERIAPTYSPDDQKIRWGEVNDPTAARMGGVAGVAGLFADAHDLGIFLQCLLDQGKINDRDYLLGPLTILKMTTPQTPAGITELRGLGWDIDSAYSNRGVLLPTGSYGHSGWTGTSAWVDPTTQTWIIILTSRTYPTPAKTNQLILDRRSIADIVAASLTDIKIQNLNTTGIGELQYSYSKHSSPSQ